MALIVNTKMLQFFQQILQIGPDAAAQPLNEGGSYAALGSAAVMVAVAIWRRGHRD
ncbi:MAG: hypothetical protein RI920_1299 [Pseudomonadota bacterium]|jgi:hypothetical protein